MSKKNKKLQEKDIKHEEEKQISDVVEGGTSLDEQLSAKDEEIRSYVDRLQHLQAEFENYKKREVCDSKCRFFVRSLRDLVFNF